MSNNKEKKKEKGKLKANEQIPDSIKKDAGIEQEEVKLGINGKKVPQDVAQSLDHNLKDRS